jgi:hypothetical protein
MDMNDKEAVARKIEEHIATLVDYDVIEAQVGDTLSEYVWAIILGEQAEAEKKLATVSDLGEKNEVHLLGPVGLKHNR